MLTILICNDKVGLCCSLDAKPTDRLERFQFQMGTGF